MDFVAKQVQNFTADARNTVDSRLSDFKKSILEEFASNSEAKSEAFADPDFQHSLLEAQTSFARSGDANLQEVLVDLIVQRSKQTVRDRLTLTLNDAIEKAKSLTDEDFSALSLAFIFKNMQNNGINDVDGIVDYLRQFAVPIYGLVSKNNNAYHYLESHGCVVLGNAVITFKSVLEILQIRYPGIVTNGLTNEEILSLFPNNQPTIGGFIVPSPFDPSRFVFALGGSETLKQVFAQTGLGPEVAEGYIGLCKANAPSVDKFADVLRAKLSEIDGIIDAYNGTPVKDLRLTSTGVALAHANLTKKTGLSADLSIWIN